MAKTKYVVMRVLKRGLVDIPIWNSNRRGRNWCAVVKPDPNAPGGMTRAFWTQARGQAAEIFKYVIPEGLSTYDVIEFGADHVSYGGHRSPERWYGIVLALNDTQLFVCPCKDAVTAFTTADELREAILAKAPAEPPVDLPVAAAGGEEPPK